MLSHVWLFATLWTRHLWLRDSARKNTGVGCHFLLQEIFLTQGLNPCLLYLLHWQVGSLSLSHLGSPTECLPCVKDTRQQEMNCPSFHLQSLKSPDKVQLFSLVSEVLYDLQLLSCLFHHNTRSCVFFQHKICISAPGQFLLWGFL